MNKILKAGTKDVEAGVYSFRTTATNPHDNGIETVYSKSYLVLNITELNEAKAGWLDGLRDKGYTQLRATANMQQERQCSFGSIYEVLKGTNLTYVKSIINKDVTLEVIEASENKGKSIFSDAVLEEARKQLSMRARLATLTIDGEWTLTELNGEFILDI